MNIKKLGGAFAAGVVLATASGAALSQVKIRLEPVVTGLNTPLAMVQPAEQVQLRTAVESRPVAVPRCT